MAFVKVGSSVRYGLLRPEKTVCLLGSSNQRHLSDANKSVRIGCSSGFWGDTATAVPQLIYGGKIQYLIGDYLSELTMSLLAAVKAKNPQHGFTPDFVESIAPFLGEIKKRNIRVVTNGGGMNPKPCVAMLQSLCKKSGVELKIADVSGDDLMPHKDALISENVKEMFSGKDFPSTVNSMNAYYGAGPVVKALDMGADIVITGRCTDSALALAPLIHEFGWASTDFDKLAAGSLAGHLIECGAQCTGGNHTDWHTVPDFDNLGFPIADVSANGDMTITKPPGTGGLLTVGAVAEQMLYEIGDPRSYILPDVVADFSQVQMKETEKGVWVTGAKGRAPTPNYKVCATYLDGFKSTCVATFVGDQSAEKARVMADSIFKRTRKVYGFLGIPDFEKTHVQIIGAEDSFGANAMPADKRPREAVLWMSAKHADKKALGIWAKEIAAVGTGGTPGICGVVGGRPKPTPNLKLFSFLYPKSKVDATVFMDGAEEKYVAEQLGEGEALVENKDEKVSLPKGEHSYTLRELAFTRSGDKGNSCNIGVVARDPAYLPYIKDQVTEESVAKHFKHMFEGEDGGVVHRYDLPGISGLNFLLEASLGGGGIASLRPDPLGKAYGQILADLVLTEVPSLEEMKK